MSCHVMSLDNRSNSSSVSAIFSAVGSISSDDVIAYLNVGDTVKLIGGVLGPACPSTNPNCQSTSLKAPSASVITAAPLQPSSPTVVLIAPQGTASSMTVGGASDLWAPWLTNSALQSVNCVLVELMVVG